MTRSSERSKSERVDGSGKADSVPRIPDHKKYFRIGEVSRIVGVEAYVLRYWESEIPQIRPSRADSNQRTYQRKDLEILLEVKRLLYDEKLTIEGARKRLRETRGAAPRKRRGNHPVLEGIRRDLNEILNLLS
jgi:DNA-binding transcriptional MerR regulator